MERVAGADSGRGRFGPPSNNRLSAPGTRLSAVSASSVSSVSPSTGSRVRFAAPFAILLAACGRQDRNVATSAQSATKTAAITGPQSLVLRISREGSPPRVTSYPRTDSTLWRSGDPAPTPAAVFAFD